MRIALVVPDLAGAGAQRVMIDLAAGMVAAGESVDVVVVGRADGALRASVPAEARVVAFGAARVANGLPAMVRYLRRERPDAVVSCLSHVNLLTLLAARVARTRARVMVTQHNHLSSTSPRKPTRRARAMPRLLAVAFRFADRIVAVSDGVADDLAATLGLDRARIDVVYNPVDVARLEHEADAFAVGEWPDGEGPRVLAVGRLTAQKDYPNLLRALAASDGVRALVCGDGEDRAALERLAVELGVQHRVRFLGFVANPFPYFKAADVFVLSSAWEGLPTVLIEALALSSHVVATDCPAGPREILDAGRWGALVPVADPIALASAIAAAPGQPPIDRVAALSRYNPTAVTARYLQLLA